MINKFNPAKNLIFKIILLLLVTSNLITSLTGSVYAQTTPVAVATLSLDPSTAAFNRGCTYPVNIMLNTQAAQTDGADAILIYDPTRLTGTSIISGTIFADYPGNSIDTINGKITVTSLASITEPFTGQGILATVNFNVKVDAPLGVTQVNFDFDPNDKTKTSDSNVVERGTTADILNSIVNGSYTVGTGACSNQGASEIASSSATTPPFGGSLPPAGSETLTFTLAIIGSILTVLGILGLALL